MSFDFVFIFIIGFYVLMGLGVVGLIIYLIVERLKEKDNETFEDRDN